MYDTYYSKLLGAETSSYPEPMLSTVDQQKVLTRAMAAGNMETINDDDIKKALIAKKDMMILGN